METGMHMRTVRTVVASTLAALLFWVSTLPPPGLGLTAAAQEEEAKAETTTDTTPPPYSGLPACQVGMALGTGEGCHARGSQTSVVVGSEAACVALFDPTLLVICHAAQIDSSAVLSASKDDSGSWIIDELAGAPADCSELRGLHEAARLGNADWVACLAAAGADVNARDERGETPLHIAVEKGSEELARILLAAGADVNVLSHLGRSVPITEEALTRIFTSAGSDVTVPDAKLVAKAERSVAPLQVAVENSDLELVRMLVVAGMAMAAPENAPEQTETPAPAPQTATAQEEEAKTEAETGATTPPYSGLQACQAGMKLGTGEGCHASGSGTSVVVGSQSACVALFAPTFLVICHAMQIDSSAVVSASKDEGGSWIIGELAGAPASCGELNGLHEAVLLGNAEWVACLAQTGADVNTLNERGNTPLHIAVEKGDDELVQILLDAGADVGILSNGESSVPIGLKELAKVFASPGSELSFEDAEIIAKASVAPLQIAVANVDLELVQMLVVAGGATPEPSASAQDSVATKPPRTAAADADGKTQLDQTLAAADLNAKDGDGNTPLSLAISAEDKAMLRLLIAAGADPNVVVNPEFRVGTHLTYAVGLGNADVVQILLDAGADPNVIDTEQFYDQTPLTLAISAGDAAMLRLLIAAGADPNKKVSPDFRVGTHLTYAVGLGDKEIVRTLLDAGADPNVIDTEQFYDQTPLSLAIGAGDVAMLRFLIAAGADPNLAVNPAFRVGSHLGYAMSLGNTETVQILLDAGADPNIIDDTERPDGNRSGGGGGGAIDALVCLLSLFLACD